MFVGWLFGVVRRVAFCLSFGVSRFLFDGSCLLCISWCLLCRVTFVVC